MTGLISRLFRKPADDGDRAFNHAMSISDELIEKMRAASSSTDPVRAVMADLWQQRHNVPFVTTIYEAAQEVKSGLDQQPGDLPP